MTTFTPTDMTRLWWKLSTDMWVNQMRCAQVFFDAMSKPQQDAVLGMAAPMNACGVGFGTMALRPDPTPRRSYKLDATVTRVPRSKARRVPSLPPVMAQAHSIPV